MTFPSLLTDASTADITSHLVTHCHEAAPLVHRLGYHVAVVGDDQAVHHERLDGDHLGGLPEHEQVEPLRALVLTNLSRRRLAVAVMTRDDWLTGDGRRLVGVVVDQELSVWWVRPRQAAEAVDAAGRADAVARCGIGGVLAAAVACGAPAGIMRVVL